jgi:hypothetical protein
MSGAIKLTYQERLEQLEKLFAEMHTATKQAYVFGSANSYTHDAMRAAHAAYAAAADVIEQARALS